MKIIIGGDGGTGKTTLIQTKKFDCFQPSTKITIGVDFACFPLKIYEKEITFLIYDLGGQRRFQFLHDSYIVGSRAGLILYDLTREQTFDNVINWYQLFRRENATMPIIIAGTKMDLIQNEDLYHFLQRWNHLKPNLPNCNSILGHIFISSKNYINVNEIFFLLGKNILQKNQILKIRKKK